MVKLANLVTTSMESILTPELLAKGYSPCFPPFFSNRGISDFLCTSQGNKALPK